MKIILGSRGSNLAIAQTRIVASMLTAKGAEVEIRTITTLGDTLDIALSESGGKGVFVKELDEALLSDAIDVAVHSLKDVPAHLPKGISIAAVTARADPRDVFVSNAAKALSGLPKGARVGTSSPRRRSLLFKLRPDLDLVPMRGNIDTRLEKLDAGEVDAIVLAAAGLLRLGLKERISDYFSTSKLLPAVGQGALSVEVKSDKRDILKFVQMACHHPATGIAVRAERSFLKATGGDCHTPLAAYAELRASGLVLNAFLAAANEASGVFDRESGAADEAQEIGIKLAERMLGACIRHSTS